MKIKKIIAITGIISTFTLATVLITSCANTNQKPLKEVEKTPKKDNLTEKIDKNLQSLNAEKQLLNASKLDAIAKTISFDYDNKEQTLLKDVKLVNLKHSLTNNNDLSLEIVGLYPKENSKQDLTIYYKLIDQKTKETKGYYFQLKGFKEPNKNDSQQELSDELKNIINNIKFKETFDLAFKDDQVIDYAKTLPSQIKNHLLLDLKVIQKQYNDKIKLSIADVLFMNEGGQINANKVGRYSLLLDVLDLSTNKTYQVLLGVDGFKTNLYGADENDLIPQNGFAPASLNAIKDYNDASQQARYLFDNKNYLDALKQNQMNLNWTQVRPDLATDNKQKINEFDQKAKLIYQDSYESAAHKGFTLPVYDNNGQFQGLSFKENETGKSVSWVDTIGKDQWRINGLARTLPNEMYKQIGLQTFGIQIQTPNGKPRESDITAGTMWVMDYQKRSDGQYPTKWYFGTNLHVAEALKANTTVLGINKLMPNVPIKKTLGLEKADDNIYHFNLVNKNNQPNVDLPIGDSNGVKMVYDGRDFLKLNPSDLLTPKLKTKYNGLQEFVDFAVLEIDFEKIKLGSVWKNLLSDNGGSVSEYNNLDAHELAKLITNDYANEPNKQIKFLSKSYLSDYSRINVPLDLDPNKAFDTNKYDQLFMLGWPSSAADYFLDPIKNPKQFSARRDSHSLWINSNYQFYDQLDKNPLKFPTTLTDRGDFLSYNIGYRSFTNKPGVVDAFISSPITGKAMHKSIDNKQYISFGLNYLPMHYSPIGGSSGSSLRNQKNELVGIWHVGNGFAQTGLAAAFRSEGYDYQGLYGSYNLPQYDLIYGGGKDQKNSYRQALAQLYENQNITTALFPNGLSEEQIPNAFKFKN